MRTSQQGKEDYKQRHQLKTRMKLEFSADRFVCLTHDLTTIGRDIKKSLTDVLTVFKVNPYFLIFQFLVTWPCMNLNAAQAVCTDWLLQLMNAYSVGILKG